MKKKNVISVTVVVMLFVIALFFVSGTYARYTGEFTGEADVSVAKWAVKVNEQESTDMNLNFTVSTSDNVVENKFAPSINAQSAIQVDLTGTEVAVDLVVEKGDGFAEALTKAGLTEEEVTFSIQQGENTAIQGVTGNGDSENPFLIPLQNQSAFTADNGIFKVNLILSWANDDSHNTEDTSAGTKASTLNLPIKLSVKQHIDG